MNNSPSLRRSRVERASSSELPPSLFRRFKNSKTESFAASQPPPRHSHRRILSRDRRRPMAIYYSSNNSETIDDRVDTDGEMSEDEQIDDRFEVDAKVPDFASSLNSTACSRRPGRAFTRMSQTFSRASERFEPDTQRRAARQSAKYKVAWREDDESACCQVCFAMFTKLSRRRHHCRVCGELVCGACSQDQVALTDKFSSPRRACVACCSLFQAMARVGDGRVLVVESDMTPAAPTKRHTYPTPTSSMTCDSPSSAAMPAPAATPRFRDRLTEVRRVMAAGKLSRRRGSSEKSMFVISSRWLRSWLAFTASASTTNSSRSNPDYGFDTEVAVSTSTNDDSAPGPIDNLSLLDVVGGKLIPRSGLIRDDVLAGDAAISEEDADYQLLSPEVWEVFQRLYGGAPAIYVNLTSLDPTAWIVDVAGLLTSGTNANGTKIQVLPAVERALLNRHRSENDFASIREPRTTRMQARTSTESPINGRYTVSKQTTPKSPAWTATSSSSSSSLSEDKERGHSPMNSGKMQLEDLEADVATLAIKVPKNSNDEAEDDMRATTSMRSPTAAFAASAFAVAMKQARLNAQKAIDDRASRVVAA